jgi:hypothetical protein
MPTTAAEPAKDGVVAKVLQWFGLRRARASFAIRKTSDLQGLDVWTIDATGGAPRRLTNEGGYRSPIVCADGSVVAIHDRARFRQIDRNGNTRDIALPQGEAAPLWLIGCKDGKLGAYDQARRIVLVDLSTGAVTPFAADLSGPQWNAIWSASRACEDQTVLEERAGGTHGRSDIAVTMGEGEPRSVTASSELGQHHEPAFSPDCKRIVFVGAPAGAAGPPSEPPSGRGCACDLPGVERTSWDAGWFSLFALVASGAARAWSRRGRGRGAATGATPR